MNLADEPGLRYVARVVATLLRAFPHVAAVTLQEVLKGKRYGNLVVVASDSPFDVDELRRRAARADFPTGVLGTADLTRRARSTTAFDAVGERSPEPPDPGRWRLR